MSSEDDEDRVPVNSNFVPIIELSDYELEPFKAVEEPDDDKVTTTSDLGILNNHLAMCSAVLPNVRTVAGLCALSATVCKLIETRRKVKKLAYGNLGDKGGRTFEVLE